MPNEKLIFLSFPVFKTIFAASNQAQQKSNSRTANSDQKKRKSHNNVQRSSWRNKEFMFTRRRLTFTMMLLTNQTQHFVLNRATCIYLFLAISLITLTTSTLNSPCLFFQSFTAEKLNLATIILFPL